MKRLILPLFGLLLIFVPACQAGSDDTPGTAESAPPPSAAPADTVLARVNGTDIPSAHLDRALKLFLEKNLQDPASVPADRMKDVRKQILEGLVDAEVLYQASQAAGIRVDDDTVTQQMRSLRSRFPSDEEFAEYLEGQGLTLDEMKEQVRRNLATEQLVQREVGSKVTVSDEEIADYYEKNNQRMRRSAAVRVSEIFVATAPGAGASARSRARQKIEAILKEIHAGNDFADLARKYSESPDAKDGGDMGYISRDGTVPALAEAALRLKVGEISDVVETPYGYHILKVTDKREAGDVTLEEARPRISTLVMQQKEQEALNAYLAGLKASAKIEILTPNP